MGYVFCYSNIPPARARAPENLEKKGKREVGEVDILKNKKLGG